LSGNSSNLQVFSQDFRYVYASNTFPGFLTFMTSTPDSSTGGNTTIVSYGGDMRDNVPQINQMPIDYLLVGWRAINESSLVNGNETLENVRPMGDFLEKDSLLKGIKFFLDFTTEIELEKLPDVVEPVGLRDIVPVLKPRMRLFSAVFVYAESGDYQGWSIVFFMLIDGEGTETFCMAMNGNGQSCFVQVGRWRIINNGKHLGPDEVVSFVPKTTFYNCTADGGDAGPTYSSFYNPNNCFNARSMLAVASRWNVSVFDFEITEAETWLDLSLAAATTRNFPSSTLISLFTPIKLTLITLIRYLYHPATQRQSSQSNLFNALLTFAFWSRSSLWSIPSSLRSSPRSTS
jgi:hypothetical protein